MQILLVDPRMEPTSQPPLGLAYLASYLRNNGYYDIVIIDTSYESLSKRAKGLKPNVVGIYCMTPYLQKTRLICNFIRKRWPESIILIGGPHATILPEETLSFTSADVSVIGEGEVTLLEIIKSLEDGGKLGTISGLCYRQDETFFRTKPRPFIENLDLLPFPARDLLPMDFYLKRGIMQEFGYKPIRATTFLTSRGCPFNCIYCNRVLGGKLRTRSPENVVSEMRDLIERYDIKGLFFVDDTFALNYEWLEELSQEMIKTEIKLEISINSRVDTIHPTMLQILKKTGVRHIAYGVESGNQLILNTLKKKTTLDEVKKAVIDAKTEGISVKGYFMIGCPDETLVTMNETLNLAKTLPLDQVQFSIATPYPGTELWEIAKRRGYLARNYNDVYARGYFKAGVMNLEHLKADDIERFYRRKCRPFVLKKIILGLFKEWKSIPFFIFYVVKRKIEGYFSRRNISKKTALDNLFPLGKGHTLK